MKWLMMFMAVHGVSFSSDQCRVLRQVQLMPPACRSHFANQRSLAASLSGSPAAASTPGVSASAPGASAPGRSLSGPNHGGPPGGNSPSSPSSPGGPTHGGPGSPGGGAGDIRPGQPAPPLPSTPPEKPGISAEDIAKLRDEVRQAARERVISRIINGAKPPDSSRPDFGKPGLPDPGKPGFNPGPGGMRGQASPKSSGGAAWSGQAR